jgi:predicted DNA-binding transcriptional regulator AlpA
MPEHMPPVRQLVSLAVILEMFDISRPTLEMLIAEQGFPVIKLSPRVRRFDLEAVNAWIDSRWSTRAAENEESAA